MAGGSRKIKKKSRKRKVLGSKLKKNKYQRGGKLSNKNNKNKKNKKNMSTKLRKYLR